MRRVVLFIALACYWCCLKKSSWLVQGALSKCALTLHAGRLIKLASMPYLFRKPANLTKFYGQGKLFNVVVCDMLAIGTLVVRRCWSQKSTGLWEFRVFASVKTWFIFTFMVLLEMVRSFISAERAEIHWQMYRDTNLQNTKISI